MSTPWEEGIGRLANTGGRSEARKIGKDQGKARIGQCRPLLLTGGLLSWNLE